MSLLRRLFDRADRSLDHDERRYVRLPDDGRAVYVDQPIRITSVCVWDEAGAFACVRDDGGVRYLKSEPGRFRYPAGTRVDRDWLERRVELPASARTVLVGVATPEPPYIEVR